MELANIERLIEKYESGNTSLQEEAVLRTYFTGDNIAPHLQEYAYMFNYFKTTRDEIFDRNIQLTSLKPKQRSVKIWAIAASLILLISVFIGKKHYDNYLIEKQYADVKKALTMLSVNLKKGEQAVATLYTYEDTVKRILK